MIFKKPRGPRGKYNKLNPTKPYIKISVRGIPRKSRRPWTEEEKLKQSLAKRGIPTGRKMTPEQQFKLNEAARKKLTGVPLTQEHIRKMVESRKKTGWSRNPEETKRKIGAASKKTWQSEEYRKRMSLIFSSPEVVQARSLKQKGNKNALGRVETEEQREKKSVLQKRRMEDPIYRKKVISALADGREKARIERAKKGIKLKVKAGNRGILKVEIKIIKEKKKCPICSSLFYPCYKTRVYCSRECSQKHLKEIAAKGNPLFKPQKGRKRPEISGPLHPNWKGGITKERDLLKGSMEYREWQCAVFKRDNWECQKCNKHGGTLTAHHIRNFADNKELRFALSNGVTMCPECHNRFHALYTCFNNTWEQLNEFLLSRDTITLSPQFTVEILRPLVS